MTAIQRYCFLSLLACLVSSCTLISPYDEKAYQQATDLKGQSLALMTKATEAYSLHQNDAEALLKEAGDAHEYAKNRKLNKDNFKIIMS